MNFSLGPVRCFHFMALEERAAESFVSPHISALYATSGSLHVLEAIREHNIEKYNILTY